MHYRTMSTEALLKALIGKDATASVYRGDLRSLFEVDERDRNDALGPLLIARELVHRWFAEEVQARDVLQAPAAVKQFLVTVFAGQSYESFVAIYLDAQSHVLVAEEAFRGTLTQTAVYPREIVRRALAVNAGGVIFAHNHPSGAAEPSRADEYLTSTLKTALALVDVKVIDHFVVAGTVSVSFAERGLL